MTATIATTLANTRLTRQFPIAMIVSFSERRPVRSSAAAWLLLPAAPPNRISIGTVFVANASSEAVVGSAGALG
jgi:hypothetical protein